MFNKKYSPVLLSKATTFALHLMEKGVHFVLQGTMIRFLHMTIDDTKWTEANKHGGGDFIFHKSDISVSVLCKEGKVIEVEAEIILLKDCNGEWVLRGGVHGDTLSFPSCKALKGTLVIFRRDIDTNEVRDYDVWLPNVSTYSGRFAEDKAMHELRAKLLTC